MSFAETVFPAPDSPLIITHCFSLSIKRFLNKLANENWFYKVQSCTSPHKYQSSLCHQPVHYICNRINMRRILMLCCPLVQLQFFLRKVGHFMKRIDGDQNGSNIGLEMKIAEGANKWLQQWLIFLKRTNIIREFSRFFRFSTISSSERCRKRTMSSTPMLDCQWNG